MNGTIVSTSVVGFVLLTLGAIMMWKKKSLKVVTWLWFLGGLTVSGGLIATLQDVLRQAGAAGGSALGIGVNVVLGVVGLGALYVAWLEAPLKKGKGTPKASTPFLALVAPILILTTTGTLAGWFGALGAFVGRLGGPLATFFGA
jgi:hypothetical protein